MSSANRLGWGLIGASDIAGTRMIPAITSRPDSQVAAVMSRQAGRARAYADQHGIARAYNTVEAILADPAVDVVYISSTNDLHRDQVLASAAAGKHVLCEKPLALSLEDAERMVAACRSAGVVMGVNHHLRNAATHRALRRLIAGGAIGTPLAARVFHAVYLPPRLQGWRLARPDAGGGVILDITVHDVDALRFVLDDEVTEVTALSVQQGLASGDLEDTVMGVLRFTHGALAQHHDSFTIRHARTGLELHGTEASLYAEDVMTQDPIGRIILRREGQDDQHIDTEPPEDLYGRAVRLFNAAVQGDGQPAATGEDGVRSLAVGLAVLESTRSGQRVAVRYPDSMALAGFP
ncbi:MAG TPA: Gfo/Idh/MocA family oxidoreductase [Chloroflexota bacterium]|nr:Gfo/Idh/MocA family oxidoreductase [Chloroflexota bacterium]